MFFLGDAVVGLLVLGRCNTPTFMNVSRVICVCISFWGFWGKGVATCA